MSSFPANTKLFQGLLSQLSSLANDINCDTMWKGRLRISYHLSFFFKRKSEGEITLSSSIPVWWGWSQVSPLWWTLASIMQGCCTNCFQIISWAFRLSGESRSIIVLEIQPEKFRCQTSYTEQRASKDVDRRILAKICYESKNHFFRANKTKKSCGNCRKSLDVFVLNVLWVLLESCFAHFDTSNNFTTFQFKYYNY